MDVLKPLTPVGGHAQREPDVLPPPPGRNPERRACEEEHFLRGRRMVESVFSSLDRWGLSERPYRKTQGLVFHLYAVLLGYGLLKLMEHDPAWCLLVGQFGEMGWVAFPNWGYSLTFFKFPLNVTFIYMNMLYY
ncbi:MAG: hypothetical protein N2Z75_00365 [Meiothermus sp.]|nr:hypothetical protein [Meiothermus sp.]